MNSIKLNGDKKQNIHYILIFLLAMNFLNASNILVVTLIMYIFLKIYINNNLIRIDLELIFLILFAISYFFFYSMTNPEFLRNLVYYLIGPIGLYIVGKQCITDAKSANYQLMKVILMIGLGYFIHAVLNMYVNISNNYFIYSTERLVDFWSNANVLRTLQGAYFTIISSLLFVAIFIKEKNIKSYWRILIIIASIFSLWSTILLGNRTLIVIVFITFICSGIIYMCIEKKKLTLLLKILFVLFFLMLIIVLDIGGIKTYFLESNLFTRFEQGNVIASSRWDYYNVFFSTFHLYPFGVNLLDYDVLSFPYMHNFWLDVYVQVGIIPFVFITFFTVSAARNVVKIIRNKCATNIVKISIPAVFIGIILNFMVEPILEANIYYFLTFCVIAGAVNNFLKIEKENLNKK